MNAPDNSPAYESVGGFNCLIISSSGLRSSSAYPASAAESRCL